MLISYNFRYGMWYRIKLVVMNVDICLLWTPETERELFVSKARHPMLTYETTAPVLANTNRKQKQFQARSQQRQGKERQKQPANQFQPV